MNRTAWLKDRRMEKFCAVLSRRFEEEGLTGLFDKRLGKASARRVPIDKVTWMLSEYRTHYTGWMVKYFFDHLRG